MKRGCLKSQVFVNLNSFQIPRQVEIQMFKIQNSELDAESPYNPKVGMRP